MYAYIYKYILNVYTHAVIHFFLNISLRWQEIKKSRDLKNKMKAENL